MTDIELLKLLADVVACVGCFALGYWARGKVKKCPFCTETIWAKATVCNKCRRDLPAPVAPVRN
jgi:hypothetical protein